VACGPQGHKPAAAFGCDRGRRCPGRFGHRLAQHGPPDVRGVPSAEYGDYASMDGLDGEEEYGVRHWRYAAAPVRAAQRPADAAEEAGDGARTGRCYASTCAGTAVGELGRSGSGGVVRGATSVSQRAPAGERWPGGALARARMGGWGWLAGSYGRVGPPGRVHCSSCADTAETTMCVHLPRCAPAAPRWPGAPAAGGRRVARGAGGGWWMSSHTQVPRGSGTVAAGGAPGGALQLGARGREVGGKTVAVRGSGCGGQGGASVRCCPPPVLATPRARSRRGSLIHISAKYGNNNACRLPATHRWVLRRRGPRRGRGL
jgi:hypothetical protein